MEITGKLIQLGKVAEGKSQNGEWRKATAIFETDDKYPKNVAIVFWDNNKKKMLSDIERINIGSMVRVMFDLASREFNGKWYTDCTAYLVEPLNASANTNAKNKKKEEDPADDLPW